MVAAPIFSPAQQLELDGGLVHLGGHGLADALDPRTQAGALTPVVQLERHPGHIFHPELRSEVPG